MAPQADYYSPVSIVTVPGFTPGRNVIVSPLPENDVQMYLDRFGLRGYQRILDFPGANGFKENHGTEFLGCFEEVYECDGGICMDIYIHADCVGKAICTRISAGKQPNKAAPGAQRRGL